jgi:hypothetical protein
MGTQSSLQQTVLFKNSPLCWVLQISPLSLLSQSLPPSNFFALYTVSLCTLHSSKNGKAVVAFKLLSRDTRGRVEARQLLVPEEVSQVERRVWHQDGRGCLASVILQGDLALSVLSIRPHRHSF